MCIRDRNSVASDPSFPLPGARPYSLIGRLESSDQHFYIGTSNALLQSVSVPTRLFLRTNDDVPGNGNGSFACKTELWKVLPDSRADFWGDMSAPSRLSPGVRRPVSAPLQNARRTT